MNAQLHHSSVSSLMRSGIRCRSEYMDMIYTMSEHEKHARTARVIVSKKVDARAVARNRMRRLVREAVRLLGVSDIDMVFVVRRPLPDTQGDVSLLVRTLFDRARLKHT